MCEGGSSRGVAGKQIRLRRFWHSVGQLSRFLTKPHEAKGKGSYESTKRIQWITEFAKLYKIAGEVRPSGQKGTEVRYAKRMSDGQNFVIKVRNKSTSKHSAFSSPEVEATWRESMELMLNCCPSDNIASVLQVLENDSCYYVVMELADGKDLFDLLQASSLGDKELRSIIRQLLHALGVLHDQGIIHRDTKLENVVMGKDLSVKLIDFDDVESWPRRPIRDDMTRWVCGTDQYIAPEAYLGDFSPASDLFAVGSLLYRMLFGRLPFNVLYFDDKPGENYVGSPKMRIISERIGQSLMDWGTCKRLRMPPTAGAVAFCKRLMAFDKGKRYASAAEALGDAWFTETPLEQELAWDAHLTMHPHQLQHRMSGDLALQHGLRRAVRSATYRQIPDMKDEEDVDVLDFEDPDPECQTEEPLAAIAPPSPKWIPPPEMKGLKSMDSETSSSIEMAFPPGWILDAPHMK
eukprot:TRINITY_DN27076_c0_g2_i1.p1 TRINITY_DN27076_c0_g2~~TRINITY_DN27076_c0_g2_i1.p1  ORF type:complete len:463 (-),score=86.93 TRINITY_DN27076_c0_g2_i1:41-1429(-)